MRALLWNHVALEATVAIFLAALMITNPAIAAMRLQDRSLYINSGAAGATTFYKLSFRYMSPDPVGSVELLFCDDPIPYHPCTIPTGMDVSGATLSQQTGETGFSIGTQSTNRIVLTRAPGAPTDPMSSYLFDNVVNPTSTGNAFAIRIKTHASSNASGPQIDFGSVRSQVVTPIEIVTQVPPMLIFCLAEQVEDNCVGTNDVYYNDMGELKPDGTLTAQSQMAVGTNASGGFAIVANATPMSAGTNVIDSPTEPTLSQQGTNQFGINLVANTSPTVGSNPEGAWTNAVVSDGYDQTDRFMFETGDVVAYSPNVSLMKKFTVSYILNTSPELRAGVYSTTVNYVASGRF
jgi:hypothetical protein